MTIPDLGFIKENRVSCLPCMHEEENRIMTTLEALFFFLIGKFELRQPLLRSFQ